MRKILYIIAGFFFILIIAIIVIAWMFDINQYKDTIQAEAREALGREVSIEGDLSLSLLPYPAVTASKVKIANDKRSSSPDMIHVEYVSASIAWLPLLTKQIHVNHIQIRKPVIFLEKYKNGQANWDFLVQLGQQQPKSAPKEEKEGEKEVEKISQKQERPVISISSLDIKNGHLEYREGTSVTKIDDFNLHIEADDLQGPYALSGDLKVAEKPAQFNIDVGQLQDDQPLDIKTNFKYAQHQLTAKGTFDLKTTQFKGDVTGKAHLAEFEKIAKRFGDSITFTSQVVGSPEMIEATNLKVTFPAAEAQGKIHLELTGTQKYAFELTHLPGNTSVMLSGAIAHMDPLQGHLDFISQDSQKFLKWSKIDVAKVPSKALQRLTLKTDFKLKNNNSITLSNISLQAGKATVSGNLAWQAPILTIDLQTPQIGSWLNLAAMNPKQALGAVKLKGSFEGNTDLLQTDATVQMLDGTFRGRGQLKNLTEAWNYNLALDINHSNLNKMMSALGTGPLPVVIGQVKLTANVNGNASQVQATKIHGSIAPKGKDVTVDGQGTYLFDRPKLTLDIKLGDLVVEHFLADSNIVQNPKKQISGNLKSQIILASAKTTPQPNTPPANVSAKWSKIPIDLSGLNVLDIDAKIHIASLIYSTYKLDNISMSPKLTGGTLDIPDLSSNVFDGKFSGKLTLIAAKQIPSLSLTAQLQNAKLTKLIEQAKDWNITGGQTSMDLNLTTAVRSEAEMVAHLNGAFNFHVDKGTLQGINLSGLTQSLRTLRNPADLLGVMESFMSKGTTAFNTIKGRFNIVNGVARTNDIIINTSAGNGSAEGFIDLPQYRMDITGTFKLADLPNFPPFGIKIVGPIDNPKTSYEIGQISTYLFQLAGGKLINRFIGGAVGGPAGAAIGTLLPSIGGILGGSRESPTTPTPEEDSKEQPPASTPIPAPKKILKGVIRGIFN